MRWIEVPCSEDIKDIRTDKQLFFDDEIVETSRWVTPRRQKMLQFTGRFKDEGEEWEALARGKKPALEGDLPGHVLRATQFLKKRFHQPRKLESNPILSRDKPWEGLSDSVGHVSCGNILKDENDGLWKMWYGSCGSWGYYARRVDGYQNNWGSYTLYAVSQDGLHWDKPDLGLIDFENYKNTNIVHGSPDKQWESLSVVFRNPDEDEPEKRYMAISKTKPNPGVHTSPDGIHWTPRGSYQRQGDETLCFMHDPVNKKYIQFTRNPYKGNTAMLQHGQRTKRAILSSVSDDLVHWTSPELILAPDGMDPMDISFYGMESILYENLYVGFLQIFHTYGPGTADVMELQLAFSRDGLRWERTSGREVFLPLGESGSWDCGMVSSATAVTTDDAILIYYNGSDGSHGSNERNTAIGIAELRLDGFVSLDAGNASPYQKQHGRVATLLTKPLYSTGKQLAVNAAARGFIEAELLDLQGAVRKGFGRKDCDSFSGDELRHGFSWRGKSDISDLFPSRIRFYMEDAELYSLRISD